MKKYDNYKDSGIAWIGEIPEHWSYSRLKLNSISKTGTTPSRDNDEYWENGTVPWMSSGEINQRLISSIKSFVTEKAFKETSLSLFPKGSLVIAMNGQGKTKGMVGILNVSTSFNQSLTAFQFNEKVNSRYVYYFLDSKYDELRGLVGEDREGLSSALLKNIYHPLPQFEEQTQIANFLDLKTSQIDNLIGKKEQFINLLQEERTAVINQAVTKGLDPKVNMKDSGIEWLGEIPEHWEAKPLKHLVNIQGRIGFKGYTVNDLVSEGEGALTLGAKHINKQNQLDLSNPEYISWEKYYESPEIMVYKNDLLLTQRGTLGKVVLISDDIGKATINPSMVLLNQLKVSNKYLYYFFNSDYFKSWVDFTNTATAVPMISQGQLGNFKIVIPAMKEQLAIVNFITESILNIDEIVSKAEKEIELLKEYKTALISEVVTGKVDVRDMVLN